MDRSRLLLAGLLQLLAILYAAWFWGDRQYTLALLVFALPPLLLMIGVMARRPSARASAASSSLGCGSSSPPATWLAPYGVPPVRVLLSCGSVNGMPTITQP